MKEFFPVLHMTALFSGISDEELAAMLSCLGARIGTFPKGSRLLRAGEAVEEVGLVLAGSALIVQEDIWGNRNIHISGLTALLRFGLWRSITTCPPISACSQTHPAQDRKSVV